jgi:hypothetical protein
VTTSADYLAINVLITNLFRTFSERRFEGEWSKKYFTEDVKAESPHGVAEGPDAVRQAREAVEAWAQIQYMNTDMLIDVDEVDADRATASWNALMTHIPHEAARKNLDEPFDPLFTVGGVRPADLDVGDCPGVLVG